MGGVAASEAKRVIISGTVARIVKFEHSFALYPLLDSAHVCRTAS
jgi:hypothetical protein